MPGRWVYYGPMCRTDRNKREIDKRMLKRMGKHICARPRVDEGN
jgi:hypothetical protein